MRMRAQYLTGSEVNLKKYLYAVRPALCLRWIRQQGGALSPPMDMPTLLASQAPSTVEREAILELTRRKQQISEIGTGPRIACLDALIEEMIVWAGAFPKQAYPDSVLHRIRAEAQDLLRASASWAEEPHHRHTMRP